jgi:hypothetical protein
MAPEINDKIPLSTGLGSVELVFGDDDVVELLRTAIQRKGNQKAFAKHHSINRTYLNMVLSGKRPVGEAVAQTLGLHKVYAVRSTAADGYATEIAPEAIGELIDG